MIFYNKITSILEPLLSKWGVTWAWQLIWWSAVATIWQDGGEHRKCRYTKQRDDLCLVRIYRVRFQHGTYTSKLPIWQFSLTTSDCSYLSVSETQMLILQWRQLHSWSPIKACFVNHSEQSSKTCLDPRVPSLSSFS